MPQPVKKRDYCKIDDNSVLSDFGRFLTVSGRSPGTYRLYLSALRRFSSYVVLLSPCRSSVESWIRARRRPLSRSAFNLELSAIRKFYRWLHEWEYVQEDFSGLLPTSSRPAQRLPRYLSEYEVGQLLAAPDLSSLVGFRDHVMIRLLYETGLRASELVRLSMGDILTDNMVYVHQGKGRVDRYVPFSEEMGALIRQWLKIRIRTRPGKAQVLFVTARGRPFRSGRAVWEIVNRYARASMGVGCGYTRIETTARQKPWTGHYPHLLRSSFASHLLQNGCDLMAIAEMLGHRSVSTTARYLGIDLNFLRREHGKLFK